MQYLNSLKRRTSQSIKKNGSIAVWCEADSAPELTNIETHFNFWRLAGDKQRSIHDIIEIGLLIQNPAPISQIFIYLPTKINLSDITDCGTLFQSNSVAQGIFNEKMTATDHIQHHRIELKKENEHFCWVHKFVKNGENIDANQLLLDHSVEEGTIINIKSEAINYAQHNIPEAEKIYFRLRVKLNCNNEHPFIRTISPSDQKFQSGFQEIEYIDFRLNEYRTLPTMIDRHMRRAHDVAKIKISLVAFLAAIPVQSEILSSSIQWHKTRLLEHEPWDQYIAKNPKLSMVVYHGRKKDDINGVTDFSSYVKLHTRRSSFKIIGTYLLIAFIFGLAGNLIGAYLYANYLDSNQTEPKVIHLTDAEKMQF